MRRRTRRVLVAGALVGPALTAVGIAGTDLLSRPGPAPEPIRVAGAGAAGEAATPRPVPGEVRPHTGPAVSPARGAVVRAADVLRAWDAARARAWAAGDLAALRDLYVDRAGVSDVRLLRRYADRGYRVQGLTTQLLATTVLEHAPGRWRLRVTDRLAGGAATRAGTRVRLPHDEPDTHVVVLTRGDDGRWRVARTRTV